ncbi:MAG: hypothetical protein V1664_00970 [Candidatus Uhrbacteria bacterium]
MQKIFYKPKNRDYFEKLLSFSKVLFEICEKHNIQPIVYGSLAYAFFTQDEEIEINDIDLLVPEEVFPIIIEEIKKQKELSYQETDYNSLKVFQNDIKITFDSIKHYYSNLPENFIEISINNYPFKIISLEALKEIYVRGRNNIPIKKDAYQKKINGLAKIG